MVLGDVQHPNSLPQLVVAIALGVLLSVALFVGAANLLVYLQDHQGQPSIYAQSCLNGVPVEYECNGDGSNDWTNWCEHENWFMEFNTSVLRSPVMQNHKYNHIDNLQMNLCAFTGIKLRINPNRIDKCETFNDTGQYFCYG